MPDGRDEWEGIEQEKRVKRLKEKQGLGFVESPQDPDIDELLKKYDSRIPEMGD